MTNTTNGKITSVTIRARNGSYRCANEGYEDAQTLTVRSDGVATFVALGTRTDEYGHSVCNSVVRRSVVRLTDQQTQAVFSAFDGVLKKRFASRPMASFWMADSIADEFVIRYDGATVFYGMSMDGDCDDVSAVYALLRNTLKIPSLLAFAAPGAQRAFRRFRHAK